jgi:hypothetical protein
MQYIFLAALSVLMLVFQLEAQAQGCRNVRQPDGSWTTECPSTIPPAPTTIRPICVTPGGQCQLPVDPNAQNGRPCNCSGVNGSVRIGG